MINCLRHFRFEPLVGELTEFNGYLVLIFAARSGLPKHFAAHNGCHDLRLPYRIRRNAGNVVIKQDHVRQFAEGN